MDIAIVTSVWGDYASYVPEWADSIVQQTLPPTQVVILDAGCNDTEPLDKAEEILTAASIPVIRKSIQFTSLGAARNAAVEACTTEWAMHLDADDLLLPHALADVEAVAADADVISLGAMREGKPVVFPDITADQILRRKHGMFSCGAFRVSFHRQRPWHTRNDWVDSTFWVGLAHLGARFTSTKRVGFIYRQHADSISHSLTPQERRAAIAQWVQACNKWTLT